MILKYIVSCFKNFLLCFKLVCCVFIENLAVCFDEFFVVISHSFAVFRELTVVFHKICCRVQ